MRKTISLALSALLLLGSLPLTACSNNSIGTQKDENILRVASWDEYIDMGGEDSYYSADSRPLYEEFEDWYKETYGKTIILPESASANNWWEITEAQYEQKQKELAEDAVIDGNTDNKQEVE
jgi:spermidine/putrescine-binding protein